MALQSSDGPGSMGTGGSWGGGASNNKRASLKNTYKVSDIDFNWEKHSRNRASRDLSDFANTQGSLNSSSDISQYESKTKVSKLDDSCDVSIDSSKDTRDVKIKIESFNQDKSDCKARVSGNSEIDNEATGEATCTGQSDASARVEKLSEESNREPVVELEVATSNSG